MICKLILLFSFALGFPAAQERPRAKPQEWLPEYVERHEEEIRKQKENISAAQREVVRNPSSAEAYFTLGEAYRNAEGDNAALAREAYERAVLLKPDYAEAHKGLAGAYGNLKLYGKQVEALERAISLSPNDAEAYCRLGDAHSTFDIGRQVPPFLTEEEVKLAVEAHEQKAELAAEAYLEAIRIRPDYADAHRGLGSAYCSLKRYNESIEAYQRAIELDPNNPLTRVELGYVYLYLTDYEAALKQHKAAMQLIKNAKAPHLMMVYQLGANLLLGRIQERLRDEQQR